MRPVTRALVDDYCPNVGWRAASHLGTAPLSCTETIAAAWVPTIDRVSIHTATGKSCAVTEQADAWGCLSKQERPPLADEMDLELHPARINRMKKVTYVTPRPIVGCFKEGYVAEIHASW